LHLSDWSTAASASVGELKVFAAPFMGSNGLCFAKHFVFMTWSSKPALTHLSAASPPPLLFAMLVKRRRVKKVGLDLLEQSFICMKEDHIE